MVRRTRADPSSEGRQNVAVKLRLMRMGKKKQPTYRVVAADARSPRNGRFIEIIGTYDPRQEPSIVEIDTAKANDWIRKGAQPTETVARLLKVAEGTAPPPPAPKPVTPKAAPAPKAEAAPAPAPAPEAEAPAAEPAAEPEAEAAVEVPAEEPEPEAATEAPAAEPEAETEPEA